MAQQPAATSGRFRPQDLQAWCSAVFEHAGLPAADAATAAHMLVRMDLRGWRTHGLTRVASYLQLLKDGDFNARPRMRHSVRDGIVFFDADGAMGHVAGPAAIAAGLKALEGRAMAMVVVRDIGHLGALGLHALAAAEAGKFCFMGQHTPPLLALPGFKRRAVGSNPLAFASPVPGADPLVFDMACSAAARGHILLAAREGREIPADWALDEAGRPTTDAKAALKGPLLPTGGHKGIGIAMMIELLAGAFSATEDSIQRPLAVLREGGAAGRESAFFWLVDPDAFVSRKVFEGYMARWTGYYLESSADEARLPGHRGAALERAALRDGLSIDAAIQAELRDLGARLGFPFPSPA